MKKTKKTKTVKVKGYALVRGKKKAFQVETQAILFIIGPIRGGVEMKNREALSLGLNTHVIPVTITYQIY